MSKVAAQHLNPGDKDRLGKNSIFLRKTIGSCLPSAIALVLVLYVIFHVHPRVLDFYSGVSLTSVGFYLVIHLLKKTSNAGISRSRALTFGMPPFLISIAGFLGGPNDRFGWIIFGLILSFTTLMLLVHNYRIATK